MQTLNEVYYAKLSIVESSQKTRPGVLSIVEGTFAEADVKNRNERIYPSSLWEKVIGSAYVKEMMENRSLFGEASHPAERMDVSLPEVSHVITDLWMDESKGLLMGRADILDTPAGNIINTLVEYGSKIGISARAAGSLKETKEGFIVNEEDYNFSTFDFVPNPGFQKSRLNSVKETSKVNLKGMKEKIASYVDTVGVEKLVLIESVLKTANEEFYSDVIDRIEERKSGSTQEHTLALLEKSHRRIFTLESEKSELEKELTTLQEEAKGFSEKLSSRDLFELKNLEDDVFLLETDLETSNKRIQELEMLVRELTKKEKKVSEGSLDSLKEAQQSDSDRRVKLEESLKSEKGKVTHLTSLLTESNQRLERLKETRALVNTLEKDKEQLQTLVEEKETVNQTLSQKLDAVRDYFIEYISERTGADIGLVKPFFEKGFDVAEVAKIEEKIKSSMSRNSRYAFSSPIEVISEEVSPKSKEDVRLVGLIKSARKQ